TNRTHLADYERAITPQTALLMKVHTSNYAVQGFTSAVPESELAVLAKTRGVALATDLGSGSLIDMAAYGLPKEPTPQEMLAAGCGVVTFSGDKLLGGPQAGLIVGEKSLITRIRKFPMKRALRLSKLPLAALEATLMLYLQPELLARDLPTLRWLTRTPEHIGATAQALLAPMADALSPRYTVSVESMLSQIGSGSLPVDRLPSAGLAIAPVLPGKRGIGTALDALATALRGLPLPVIGRIADDRLLLDCRCIDDPAELLAQLPALRQQLA
ncbi:MAG: L-seryl-tRNA(Sec) selenium transferase, partial [Comamonadaceae bacterium]